MIKRFFKKRLNPIPIIGSENVKYEPAVEPSKINFRIYAKRLFLTYSRTNLSPNDVLLQLQEKFSSIDKYIISQEDHKDEPEKGKHIHVYVEFFKKINILSASKLDLKDLDKIIHGEYQAVKNKDSVISYVKKDGNFISNFQTDIEFKIKLQKIALEKVREVNIKIIYQVVKLSSELIKVVMSNDSKDLIDFWDEDRAILRRIRHININKPMFDQRSNIIINYFQN